MSVFKPLKSSREIALELQENKDQSLQVLSSFILDTFDT